eukprot:SAG31_NODE_817_length_11849_cov_6.737362_6_plen_153_part_00
MLQLQSVIVSRHSFINSIVMQMQSSHADLVEEMLAYSTQLFPIGSDGVCRNMSGRVQWAPRVSTAQLTETFEYFYRGAETAACMSVSGADGASVFGQPYCAELPAAILELIKAEPDSAIGQSYQRYARMELLPKFRLAAETLRLHGATIGLS